LKPFFMTYSKACPRLFGATILAPPLAGHFLRRPLSATTSYKNHLISEAF